MVIFKPAMPGGFEAVPFDLWFDHRVHFNSKSDMDFFEFVFDSSLPDSVGCDHRVHSVVAIERLRMRDLLEDSGFIEECAEFLVNFVMDVEMFNDTLAKMHQPPQIEGSPPIIATLHRIGMVDELLLFCKNLLFRLEFKAGANVLKDLRAATLPTEQRRLALAMMLHRRLGAGSPEIKEEILVRHILPPLPVIADFVVTEEEVNADERIRRVDEMPWDSSDEMADQS